MNYPQLVKINYESFSAELRATYNWTMDDLKEVIQETYGYQPNKFELECNGNKVNNYDKLENFKFPFEFSICLI